MSLLGFYGFQGGRREPADVVLGEDGQVFVEGGVGEVGLCETLKRWYLGGTDVISSVKNRPSGISW